LLNKSTDTTAHTLDIFHLKPLEKNWRGGGNLGRILARQIAQNEDAADPRASRTNLSSFFP